MWQDGPPFPYLGMYSVSTEAENSGRRKKFALEIQVCKRELDYGRLISLSRQTEEWQSVSPVVKKSSFHSIPSHPSTAPSDILKAVPAALMSNEHDAPEDYHLMDPPVETETLLLQQQHGARTQRRSLLSRIHLISWTAQSVLFIASLITLRQAFSLKGADARNCVEKHSLFCR